ncbi:ABC transporter permease, partial [Mesorhizobium sp. M1A.F.Ca.IN.020.32.1.1]|uniref:ABC transporter permease n=1 Tax=Mesorhizobium sp. M1A.F.Ca.IN.020.32.1.1 TaxID=2496763 RepID=UPI000FD2FE43
MSSSIVKLGAQRIALGIMLLLAVSVLIFAGTQILPGDVAQAILGQSATPESLANLREQLGLNEPAYVRYFRWLGDVLTGDLGTSMTSGQEISGAIKGRLWNTLFLAFWAAVVAVPLAIILGVIAVRYRNGWVDKLISGLALASTSFPEFFIGYVLVYFFAVKWQIFPGISTVFDGMPFLERMQAIALPVTALTLVVLAHMMRMTRAAILNVMQSAYVETAELKGLSAFAVIRKHAFPNSIAPIINVAMLNLAYLIVG